MSESKIKSWLKGQLTNAKKNEQSWSDFVLAFGEVLENHIETYIDRLKTRSSIYEMSKPDLLEETKELRKIFPLGEVSDEDLPHVIMQRQDEIHFKKTVYPLMATISREFNGMNVEWIRLYAPINQERYPYGTLFVQEDKLDDFHDLKREDFFLTSRGVIRIPVNMIQSGSKGIGEEEIRAFEARIRQVIYPLIPLRISCDGNVYYIKINILELIEWVEQRTSAKTYLDPMKQVECSTESQKNKVQTKIPITEDKPVTPVYTSPRLDAIPLDALALDRVYY